jgi:hypothetical protein
MKKIGHTVLVEDCSGTIPVNHDSVKRAREGSYKNVDEGGKKRRRMGVVCLFFIEDGGQSSYSVSR